MSIHSRPGGARLFEDGMPASSWLLRQNAVTESGALCLLYDRVRAGTKAPVPWPVGAAQHAVADDPRLIRVVRLPRIPEETINGELHLYNMWKSIRAN